MLRDESLQPLITRVRGDIECLPAVIVSRVTVVMTASLLNMLLDK